MLADRQTALTVKDVAEVLKVSRRLIYQLVQIGEIPHFRVGGAVRFEPTALSKWLRGKMRAKGKEAEIDRAYREMERTAQTGMAISGHLLLTLLWRDVLEK
jgi:excisionase family DNA binding protein